MTAQMKFIDDEAAAKFLLDLAKFEGMSEPTAAEVRKRRAEVQVEILLCRLGIPPEKLQIG